MKEMREAIEVGRFQAFRQDFYQALQQPVL
jgi:queuine/archaeosine tRNA-ribosyltransferase